MFLANSLFVRVGLVFLATLGAGVAMADDFTERFTSSNDLSFKSVRFSPNGASEYYEACITDIDTFPVSSANAAPATLTDNGFFKISPGFSLEFYGDTYDSVYIGANGYVTLGFGDIAATGTLPNHFNLPRISAFFADLNPALAGNIYWEVIGTKVVITVRNVPLASDFDSRVSYQVELYSSGGVIISWLDLPTYPALAGLSRGTGVPSGFQDSDLSSYTICASPCLNAFVQVADELDLIYSSPPLNFPVDEMDLDINGIPDVANLRLLERTLIDGAAFGHCQALAAWESNLAILESKVAVLPNSFFVHWTRAEFLRAIAGMATLGDTRFPQNLVRLLGSSVSLGIARGELNESGEPFVSWSGDMDIDGVCNRGEFEAAASIEDFLEAAFNPLISEDGGECFSEFFEFPEGEQEAEGGGGNQEGDLLCRVELRGANMVPPNNSPYFGRADFTVFGDQVLLTVTYNVPQPAQAVVYSGQADQNGNPFFSLGSGPSPAVALLSRSALDTLSTGFYIQVSHSGTLNFVDVRGQIECVPQEEEGEGGIEGEGEGIIEGEGEGDGEGVIEGEGEGDGALEGELEGEGGIEGEGAEEGEPEPFTSCFADINGQSNVPPVSTSFSGLIVVTNLGETGRVIVFHNIPSPTFGAIHLGQPGESGPELLSLSDLSSPIIIDVPIEAIAQVSGGAYVRLGYGGFSPGEIRGDLACSFVGSEEGEVEAEAPQQVHSADYIGEPGAIELTELLSIVQLFNIGSFGCGGEESGYLPGSVDRTCPPADFDYNPQNWAVELGEVLRLVQLYNAGGYTTDGSTEDGFAPLE